jgi:hypothetical protein
MYLCSVCGVCSKPGQTRQTHVIYRTVPESTQTHVVKIKRDREKWTQIQTVRTPTRKTIDRELDVCKDCKGYLDEGMTMEQVATLVIKIRQDEQQRLEGVTKQSKQRKDKPDWVNGAISLGGTAKTK